MTMMTLENTDSELTAGEEVGAFKMLYEQQQQTHRVPGESSGRLDWAA